MATIEQRLGEWQQELLDLSSRNRLLNFRPSTTRPSSIQFDLPEPTEMFQALLKGTSLHIVGREPIEADETDGDATDDSDWHGPTPSGTTAYVGLDVVDDPAAKPVSVQPGTVLANLVVERCNKVAGRLLSNARASEQEQGVNILFVAFGLLKWKERPGETTWRQSPLVLLPVKLEERVREGGFRISSTGDDPEFNQTLGERLKRDFGLEFSIDVDEETSLTDVFAEVRSAIEKQNEWSVLDQAHLGTFQFHKLRMFTDLVEHAAVAAEHDIVRALGLDEVGIASMPDGIPNEEDLDRVVAPEQSFTVLDADASQLRAVRAAVGGSHMIIEGPPGTGKSQTIANIIAESIAAGKTVLFVSEKAAAIEVVHRRLTDRGLGDLCLMLHSHKANKRDVIYDLGRRLSPPDVQPSTAREELADQQLGATRSELNTYAEALHRTHQPLGESVYWAHGALARLQDAPYLAVVPPADALTYERLDTWTQALEQAGRSADVLQEGDAHPWNGVRPGSLTLGDQEAIRHALGSVGAALAQVRDTSDALSNLIGLAAPDSIHEARGLAELARAIPKGHRLDPSWFNPGGTTLPRNDVREAASHAAAAVEAREKLLRDYDESVLGIEVPEALASYRQGAVSRFLSSAYRAHRAAMRGMAKDRRQRSPAEEQSVFFAVQETNEHDAWLNEHCPRLAASLGVCVGETESRDPGTWRQIEQDLAFVDQLMVRFVAQPPAAAFVDFVCEPTAGAQVAPLQGSLATALDKVHEETERLREYFEISGSDQSLLASPLTRFGDLAEWLGFHLRRFGELDSMLRARTARARSDAAGLTHIIERLQDDLVPTDQWPQALRRLVITHWLDHKYREDETLLAFSGDEHQALVEQFRTLDRQNINTSARRIRRALDSRRARIDAQHGGEPALVLRESQKRKRHLPLRRLFERIPNLLLTLKPCLMMSPLSVAQFLPADRYHFDLVIFDEASQVRPHDAIGAIMRGQQIVVAGDSKQLPPTSFFDRAADESLIDDEQDIRALESILDALRAKAMPSTQLLWHYRSRHEDLISFSNRNFYDSQLITFPSSSAERSPTRGVRLEYVPDAVYEDERDAVLTTAVRVNRIEALRLAQLVVQHARTRPTESLGVVALNMRQREVVEEEIKRARLLDQTLDDFFDTDKADPFFVKALEQVQGDERDVIMISVGYGKSREGKLSHHFGHLNQEAGERRLNVLITRARLQVVVVSSIRSGDIEQSKTQKRGPLLLKSYLDFAERGRIALEAQTTGGDGDYESPFEEQVGIALSQAGYTVHRQVGTSRFRIDLAIVHPDHPGRYVLGIECDGKTYHQSKTARDRDRLRQEILEGLGWTIHRIWSTNWIRQPDRELDKVIARIAQLLSDDVADMRNDWSGGAANVDTGDEAVSDGLLDEGAWDVHGASRLEAVEQPAPLSVPYKFAQIQAHRGGYGSILSIASHQITELVVDCVEVEGPIHEDLLLRRITVAFGHQRAGARIAAHVSEAIRIAEWKKLVRRHGRFLWSPDDQAVVPRGPAPDGAVREIGHISDEEIQQAMILLVERAFSLSGDELIGRTARLFGYQRTGADIKLRLEETIQAAVRAGQLSVVDGRYELQRSST